MSPIPRITKSDIKHWTDDVYFQRGQNYYEQGAICQMLCDVHEHYRKLPALQAELNQLKL